MIVFAKQSESINWELKNEVFNTYNALNSDWEQYLFLKSLAIAIDNKDKKNLNFDYNIEIKSEENEV